MAARARFAKAGDREREACAATLESRALLACGQAAAARRRLASSARLRGATPRLQHLRLAASAALARHAGDVPRAFVDMLLPVGAAIVALCTALAGYAMVKFYGVIFLGQPREPALANAQDAGFLERAGLVWLAAGCVALGVLPVQVIGMLDTVSRELLGTGLADPGAHWWLLAPAAARGASYGPLVFLAISALVIVLTLLAVRMLYHRRVRRAPPWDCGYVRLDARMQDSAEGFGQPIRHIFQPFFLIRRELPSAFDRLPRYSMEVSDRIWRYGYEPIGQLVRRVADLVAVLQQGRISTYLLYSFVTLLVLLGVVL